MACEERLLLRLEQQERGAQDVLDALREAKQGFLIALGWDYAATRGWLDPKTGNLWALEEAVDEQKKRTRSSR